LGSILAGNREKKNREEKAGDRPRLDVGDQVTLNGTDCRRLADRGLFAAFLPCKDGDGIMGCGKVKVMGEEKSGISLAALPLRREFRI